MNNSGPASLFDKIRVFPQFLLPQHLLSRLTRHLSRSQWPPLKNFLIRLFIRVFSVDMTEALQEDYRNYMTFNDFFTRPLKPSVRRIMPDALSIISPVDGFISQTGHIEGNRIFQAKNHDYSTSALLADDKHMVQSFENGAFATLYLSPADYHRIHMPVDGRLLRMVYVPGRLFAVNTHTTRVVSKLFARNERVICLFETSAGPMALVLVGAINVGSMETVWAGEITPADDRGIRTWSYENDPSLQYSKGEEIGRFNMGSTVIMLFGRERITWQDSLHPMDKVQMGMRLARITDTDNDQ